MNSDNELTYTPELLAQRFANMRQRIEAAAHKAGRCGDDVTLIAVSKFHPAAAIVAAAGLGHLIFGENYVQEALAKQQALANLALQWHFIGHVQSNKAKDVTGRFGLIHTIDSLACTNALNNRFPLADGAQDVLIQVNIGEEPQKSGVSEHELSPLAEAMMTLPHVRLRGLMCVPPFFDDGEAARPYFAKLRVVRDALATRLGVNLPHLSMGMSGDFEQAIEEGATLVRVGTSLFGSRKRPTV